MENNRLKNTVITDLLRVNFSVYSFYQFNLTVKGVMCNHVIAFILNKALIKTLLNTVFVQLFLSPYSPCSIKMLFHYLDNNIFRDLAVSKIYVVEFS